MHRAVQRLFPELLTTVTKNRPDLQSGLHSALQLQHHQIGRRTWLGYQACGEATAFLQERLPNLTLKKVRIPDLEYGYHNDHVHLRCGDLIIDPTWRQFFNHTLSGPGYHYYLFEYCDPIFVGTRKELCRVVGNLSTNMPKHLYQEEFFRLNKW